MPFRELKPCRYALLPRDAAFQISVLDRLADQRQYSVGVGVQRDVVGLDRSVSDLL